MFSKLLKTAKAAGSKKESLKVNDVLTLKARSDGGKGVVIVLGRRILLGDKYPAKDNLAMLGLEFTDKKGAVTQETYAIKDADAIHLGQVEGGLEAVQAVLVEVAKCMVKRLETKVEYDARVAKEEAKK